MTAQAHVSLIDSDRRGGRQRDVYKITNNSTSVVDTHLLIVARGLPRQTTLENASGTTSTGEPYLRVFLPSGVLEPGQSIVTPLVFWQQRQPQAPRLRYSLGLLSGQGKP